MNKTPRIAIDLDDKYIEVIEGEPRSRFYITSADLSDILGVLNDIIEPLLAQAERERAENNEVAIGG